MRVFDAIANNEMYFIAEMSANHAGSLDHALRIVREAASAGAHCIKIQTYTADTMTLPSDQPYFRIKGGLWDGYTLYDLYTEAMTPWEWHRPIMEEAQKYELDFLSSPFDATAVDFLQDMGVRGYKIASFEITDLPLISYAAKTGLPMILSTGMASKAEISDAVQTVKNQGNEQIILLKCTSEYPAQPGDMNLATIPDMAQSFGVHTGLSDHSMGSDAPVVAATLGARVIEKHFCLSREIENPDSAFSMEPAEFAAMVEHTSKALDMLGSVQYGPTVSERPSLRFRRSIFAAADIAVGERYTKQNIRVIRPSDGLAPKHYPIILGTVCQKDLQAGQPVREEHTCILNE